MGVMNLSKTKVMYPEIDNIIQDYRAKLRFSPCWISFCSMPVFGCLLVLFLMLQFGLAGRWITYPKGREHAQGVCSNFGQPKAECNPTLKYTHCVYPTFIYGVYPF